MHIGLLTTSTLGMVRNVWIGVADMDNAGPLVVSKLLHLIKINLQFKCILYDAKYYLVQM